MIVMQFSNKYYMKYIKINVTDIISTMSLFRSDYQTQTKTQSH